MKFSLILVLLGTLSLFLLNACDSSDGNNKSRNSKKNQNWTYGTKIEVDFVAPTIQASQALLDEQHRKVSNKSFANFKDYFEKAIPSSEGQFNSIHENSDKDPKNIDPKNKKRIDSTYDEMHSQCGDNYSGFATDKDISQYFDQNQIFNSNTGLLLENYYRGLGELLSGKLKTEGADCQESSLFTGKYSYDGGGLVIETDNSFDIKNKEDQGRFNLTKLSKQSTIHYNLNHQSIISDSLFDTAVSGSFRLHSETEISSDQFKDNEITYVQIYYKNTVTTLELRTEYNQDKIVSQHCLLFGNFLADGDCQNYTRIFSDFNPIKLIQFNKILELKKNVELRNEQFKRNDQLEKNDKDSSRPHDLKNDRLKNEEPNQLEKRDSKEANKNTDGKDFIKSDKNPYSSIKSLYEDCMDFLIKNTKSFDENKKITLCSVIHKKDELECFKKLNLEFSKNEEFSLNQCLQR